MVQGVNTIMGAAQALDLDAQLMLRVRDGDDESFRVLLEKHRNPVIRFVYRMVQDHAVSEELAQEVFLRVYRSRGRMSQPPDSPPGCSGSPRISRSTGCGTGETNEASNVWTTTGMAQCRLMKWPTEGLPWSSEWSIRPHCRK